MSPKVAAIVVTHNSEDVIEQCLQCLIAQKFPLDTILVVDSGSADISSLEALQQSYPINLLCTDNIGFARANNLGYEKLGHDIEYVVFVNPDLFVAADCVRKGVQLCTEDDSVAMVSGRLLGYDLQKGTASGRIDSTGILRTWYGRWYDRGQGELDHGQYGTRQMMPALCGALLFCRKSAFENQGTSVFDPDFFLYKEDIELGLRMRKAGWNLLYAPEITAFHCRGWNDDREAMPIKLRLLAAKSEVLLYKKHSSPYMLWALLKYFLVAVLHL
jgi:GT2 family glycosyltransferase